MYWENEIQMTPEEVRHVKMLHATGCKCKLPLLGYIPNKGPRCRACGIEATEGMKDTVRQYMHNKIEKFSKEISQYEIPKNLRVYEGQDLYEIAMQQLHQYFNGELSLEDIALPDNILRNIMLLWPIDINHKSIQYTGGTYEK